MAVGQEFYEHGDLVVWLWFQACFDVRESVTFWSLMQLLTEHGQSEFIELPQWLSTHPSNETRVESFNELIPKVRS